MLPVGQDARRPGREREELLRERIVLTNRIGSILATLGSAGYDPLRRDRRMRLDALRTALGQPLPLHARAQIDRCLDRLELVLNQLAELDRQRDAVLEGEAAGTAERMIQELARLSGIGVQSATLLAHEAFVRRFACSATLNLKSQRH